MAVEDVVERLARMEALMSGMQGDMGAMREAIVRLVRIEERHAATQDGVRRASERLDRLDERLDALDETVAGIKGPLMWLAGIAASVVAGLVSLFIGGLL